MSRWSFGNGMCSNRYCCSVVVFADDVQISSRIAWIAAVTICKEVTGYLCYIRQLCENLYEMLMEYHYV